MIVIRAALVAAACSAAVLAGPGQALASPGYPPTGPTNGGGGVTSTTTGEVTTPPASTGGGGSTLPFTGTEAAALATAGATALAVGTAALLAGRRRRSAAE